MIQKAFLVDIITLEVDINIISDKISAYFEL